MERIRVRAKKWGNSIGLILPKKIADEKKVRDGTELTITVEPVNVPTVGDLMRIGKNMGLRKRDRSIQATMDEIDEELWPKDE